MRKLRDDERIVTVQRTFAVRKTYGQTMLDTFAFAPFCNTWVVTPAGMKALAKEK